MFPNKRKSIISIGKKGKKLFHSFEQGSFHDIFSMWRQTQFRWLQVIQQKSSTGKKKVYNLAKIMLWLLIS